MKALGTTGREWAYPAPCDMRKGFNGLSHLVTWQLDQQLLSGDCFLFLNKRRTTTKVLTFDGSGLCIFHKRLEKNRFQKLWAGPPGKPLRLSRRELELFLSGSDAALSRTLRKR